MTYKIISSLSAILVISWPMAIELVDDSLPHHDDSVPREIRK